MQVNTEIGREFLNACDALRSSERSRKGPDHQQQEGAGEGKRRCGGQGVSRDKDRLFQFLCKANALKRRAKIMAVLNCNLNKILIR